MKKTLALVLALAMVFSTITVAFAEDTLGEDAQTCADLGMLKGETGTVDAAYVATAPTRLQAAVMFLRLKGLEAEALAFTGEDNFADGNIAWAEGANLLAYLKANPQLGWIGDGVSFNPTGVMTAQAYYKVMLEALGYKQTTAEVAGDFAWEEVLTFAASVGLSKVADVENFTVNDLAVATVEALKVNVKGTETTLAASLVAAGVVDEAKAVAAGLVEATPEVPAVAIDEAEAIGNKVVQVEYEGDVDAAAAGNVENYAIEGLEINSVVVTGTNLVRLETAAMTSGKLYKLTVGEKTVSFTGVPKDSDSPVIVDVVSEDVEEVVVEFDLNVDYAAATDVANYTISGLEIVSAEVDEDDPYKVTLTTEGLKDDTSYVLKVTNMVSIDGVKRKTESESFKSNFDIAAPKIKGDVSVRTNERIKVTFNEKVTQETAEDLANWSIKVNETDGAELEIVSVTWDDDDEDNVEVMTEAMDKKAEYKISVNNIADQRKVANVMTRPSSDIFKGVKADEDAPKFIQAVTLSPTTFTVEFNDASKLDEDSALDINNYALEDDDAGLDIESIDKLKHVWDTDHYKFVALFTVEEMPDKADAELTFIDILDEFGNAIDKEKTVDINTNKGNFASAELLSAHLKDKTHILLTFNKALDEASAENIANYSIDEEIGYPKKAEYEHDDYADYTVLLTVNELIDNKEYDVSIDGVKDLAGNTLKIVDFNTVTLAGDHWDSTAPKLEDVEVLNKYVIAMEFDEEVTLNDVEDVRMTVDGKTFVAKVVDDMIVEFSVQPYSAAWEGLIDEEYTITAVVYGLGAVEGGITDFRGNAFVLGDDEVVDGVDADDDPDYAEVEKITQVGGTFEVEMSRDVMLAGGATTLDVMAIDADGDDIGEFEVTTDDNIVYFDGDIEEDVDYYFDLSAFLVDEHDMPAVNDEVDEDEGIDETVLSGDETDEDAPVIESVVAVSRLKVEIEFSEYVLLHVDVLTDDMITLKNVDLDKNVTIDDITVDPHDNIVVLEFTTANALEGRYEYELTIEDDAVADYAINPIEADEYVFDGSDLAQD